MSNVVARVGIIGDLHLSCSSYGGHKNYPKESLEYFSAITRLAEERQITHLIDTGDFTFGKFNKLEYREQIEKELIRQNEITNGNRYQLLGNHDTATNGMTEHEYYVRRGLLKPSTKLELGAMNIYMLDYRKDGIYSEEDTNIEIAPNKFNIGIAHQYFKYKDTQLPNFGEAIILDDYKALFGTDYLICGHVHHAMGFTGSIVKDGQAHKCTVQYMGCMMRPAYREGLMDKIGQMTVLTIYDDNKLEYDIAEIPLWTIEESFNIAAIKEKQIKKEEKAARVDISDVVKQLDAHDRNVGNPEDIIKGMSGIDDRYKNKAISLLQSALG